MKNVKKLSVKSIEGLEVRNLQRFPSMEWGPNGGLQADLYFNGKPVVQIFNEGEGGCCSSSKLGEITKQFKEAVYAFLCRLDGAWYGPNATSDLYKDKNATNVDDDEFEAVITILESYDEDFKEAKKILKKNGNSLFVRCYNKDGLHCTTFTAPFAGKFTRDQIAKVLTRNNSDISNFDEIRQFNNTVSTETI